MDTIYPTPVAANPTITEATSLRHLAHLSPYKAPGPGGIQNIYLTKCTDIIAPWLVIIHNVILSHDWYYDTWQEFLTIVLCKPGKASYSVSKAYRPIALLGMLGKVLMAIVSKQLTYLCKAHQLLPATQFGGRLGRTTTDSMHILNDIITSAWAKSEVALILFLDVEGAFLNAVPEVLRHNLRMSCIPEYVISFFRRLLDGRRTELKFDGYESAAFPVLNGIPQGDPMSLIIYLFYSADLLRVPQGPKECAAGFVDDSALVAIGATFEETHARLQEMFERKNGAHDWATRHFSLFKPSKFKLIDFSRAPEPPPGQPTDPLPLSKPPPPKNRAAPAQDNGQERGACSKPRRLARPELILGTVTIKPSRTQISCGTTNYVGQSNRRRRRLRVAHMCWWYVASRAPTMDFAQSTSDDSILESSSRRCFTQ